MVIADENEEKNVECTRRVINGEHLATSGRHVEDVVPQPELVLTCRFGHLAVDGHGRSHDDPGAWWRCETRGRGKRLSNSRLLVDAIGVGCLARGFAEILPGYRERNAESDGGSEAEGDSDHRTSDH